LEQAKGKSFEQSRFVISASAQNAVVVPNERRVAGAGPGAPRLSVRSDDDVAHPDRGSFVSLLRRPTVGPVPLSNERFDVAIERRPAVLRTRHCVLLFYLRRMDYLVSGC